MLLKELRETLDQEFADDYKEISLAVHVDPFTGSDGKPMADVSAYVPYFDHINLMTYGKKSCMEMIDVLIFILSFLF